MRLRIACLSRRYNMAGRVVEQNSLASAKRKAEYLVHKNRLIGEALQEKLAEDKEKRSKHQRKDLIRVKEGNVNE